MILVNPKTNEKIEVDDAHGEMLLNQGFYKKETKVEKPVVEESKPKPRRGRPRKVK